ncbi:hypothetical protein [Ohtaekwangia sp.]|uniref:hypothetical protein n=1 Tax=Ohtaekwangia sp. TaxID=2066019 RepID=UPI002F944FE2
MVEEENKKLQQPETLQDYQAPQDENPMAIPKPSRKNSNSEKTLNDRVKKEREQHLP